MKTLSSAFRTSASGDSNKPIEVYDLYLDNTTLHLVNYNKNVDFFDIDGNAQSYIAIPVARESYEHTVENPINSIILGIANVDRSMSAYLASHEFRGRRVVIRKIFADQLTTSGDVAIMFDGVMDAPSADEQTIQLTAVDRIGTLKRQCPRRWYQLLCNNKFFDDQCSYSRTSGDMYSTIFGEASGDCTESIVKSQHLGQPNGYWNDGELVITSGANGRVKRKITISSGDQRLVKLDVNLDNALSIGDTFTISRNCDKTWYRCSGDFQNDANFSGFPTIPEEMIIR